MFTVLESAGVTKWFVGLAVGGSLFDRVDGPFDTEGEARAAAPEILEDYGNPAYYATVYAYTFVDQAELDAYVESL